MEHTQLKALLEAIVYVSEEPVTVEQLAEAIDGVAREELRAVLEELVADCQLSQRGIEIRAVAGGYKMYTKTEHHEAVRQFVRKQKPPLRLTMPALETLAVVAYRQPVTLPEIQRIRGVNAVSVIKTLLDKNLIVTAGRKQCIGRPILYRTSKEFLLRFGLKDVSELPTLEEFSELARASLGELAEALAPSPEAAPPRPAGPDAADAGDG